MDALSAENLGVHLGGHAVLRSIDLAVAEGEIVGIFGPSGAGKSTLFRALAGEERLASGRVRIGGEDVTAFPLWERARRGLGYLPQTPSVLWDLTVAQNIEVFQQLSARSKEKGPSRAPNPEDLIRDLGLADRRQIAASVLSGGERRRLELARSLCAAPRVLLCDEPFAAVDPSGAARVSDMLSKIAAEGAAVIIADHRMAEALRLCHRAALLVDGQVELVIPAAEFTQNALVRARYALA